MKIDEKRRKHRIGIEMLVALFALRQFRSIRNHHHADVVANRLCNRYLRILCGEHDQEVRTVLPNVIRNLRNGADAVVILAPDERRRSAYRRKLKRCLERSAWTRVGIITYATADALIARDLPTSAVNKMTP
jgi:uncharacterized membrane protein YccC